MLMGMDCECQCAGRTKEKEVLQASLISVRKKGDCGTNLGMNSKNFKKTESL